MGIVPMKKFQTPEEMLKTGLSLDKTETPLNEDVLWVLCILSFFLGGLKSRSKEKKTEKHSSRRVRVHRERRNTHTRTPQRRWRRRQEGASLEEPSLPKKTFHNGHLPQLDRLQGGQGSERPERHDAGAGRQQAGGRAVAGAGGELGGGAATAGGTTTPDPLEELEKELRVVAPEAQGTTDDGRRGGRRRRGGGGGGRGEGEEWAGARTEREDRRRGRGGDRTGTSSRRRGGWTNHVVAQGQRV